MTSKSVVHIVCFMLLIWTGAVSAAERPPRILVDQGHGQRFLIEEQGELQLSKLAEIMRGSSEVVSTTKPLNDATLNDAAALVISGPFKPLLPEEIDAVVRFVQKGGRLAVMLHIGYPLSDLLDRLGVDHSNYVLHERQNVIDQDINFRVTSLAASSLFIGVTQFSAYGCWAINPGTSAVQIAQTSPDAWVDMNGDKVLSQGDVVSSFAVVVTGTVGSGTFLVFGDDAIFQNRHLDDNNSRLAANLGKWLTGR